MKGQAPNIGKGAYLLVESQIYILLRILAEAATKYKEYTFDIFTLCVEYPIQ